MFCVGYTDTLTMSVPLQVLKLLGADQIVVDIICKYIENKSTEVPYHSNVVMISYLIAGTY
jgi:hypothetical protein